MSAETIEVANAPNGSLRPTLQPGEVHVWATPAHTDPHRRDALARHLTRGELDRAERFRAEGDATRYTISRGVLRLLLGRYLDSAASEIVIGTTDHGRPMCLNRSVLPDLDFNLSHSGDLALFSFGRVARLGVDIERIGHVSDIDNLIATVFSPSEQTSFWTLDSRTRREAFFVGWTRKEAVVKAVGDGLSHPLDSFDVTVRPDDIPRIIRFLSASDELESWSLHDLNVGADYAASLAVKFEGPESPRIRAFRLCPKVV